MHKDISLQWENNTFNHINSRGQSLLRKVNGKTWIMQNTSDVIHDIEMTCEYVVFPQKGYIFMHDLAA